MIQVGWYHEKERRFLTSDADGNPRPKDFTRLPLIGRRV